MTPEIQVSEYEMTTVRAIVLRAALGLNIKGRCLRPGKTPYEMAQEEFGFEGSMEEVYAQLHAFVEAR